MKIYSASQISAWDQYTIEHEPVSSIDLMERAAQACTQWLLQHNNNGPYKIICGKGNNGGDGLAIARQLLEQGALVEVYILETGKPGSKDFQINLQRLSILGVPITAAADLNLNTPNGEYIIVEALFGTGLNHPLNGEAADLISQLNRANRTIVSVDVPAGLFADETSVGNIVVKATHTLTFQRLKLAFVLPENEVFTGKVHVLDIGLHPGFEEITASPLHLLTPEHAGAIYKPRSRFSHKGTFGHTLVIGGKKGSMGACILSAKAALRSGCGIVTAAVPLWGLKVVQAAFLEAMAMDVAILEKATLSKYNAIAIGPGLGTSTKATNLVHDVAKSANKPMVFDADALNILAANPSWLQMLPPESILTPHPKEFERLFGKTSNDFERLELALEKARELKVNIVLKGHYTFIASTNGTGYFNTTGNSGMATGGSGDVLTGIIAGLLSQGYTPTDAAKLGVFLHGSTGDMAVQTLGEEALIAGDLISSLGSAFLALAGQKKDPWKGV